MDRGAWPFFVDEVTCLVISVFVCGEKREERREDHEVKKGFRCKYKGRGEPFRWVYQKVRQEESKAVGLEERECLFWVA